MQLSSFIDPSVSPQIASAGSSNVAYVLGAVFGFLALLILVAVGIYCVRKRQQVRKPSIEDLDYTNSHVSIAPDRMYRQQPEMINTSFAHVTKLNHVHNININNGERHVRFDNDDSSLYGHDPTKTIRKAQWSRSTNQQLLY